MGWRKGQHLEPDQQSDNKMILKSTTIPDPLAEREENIAGQIQLAGSVPTGYQHIIDTMPETVARIRFMINGRRSAKCE